MPRTFVKGQVLLHLVAEFAKPSVEEEAKAQGMGEKSVGTISLQEPTCWKVYVDGAANQKGSGVRLVLISPERITIEKSLRLDILAMNNEVEYEALLKGISWFRNLVERQ